MHFWRFDQPANSVIIKTTVKYGRRDPLLSTNAKYVHDLWRLGKIESHCNNWKPRTIYIVDPETTQPPNTTVPTCATYPRHARINTPEDQGPRDIFRPYDLPNPSTSASYNNPPPISRQWQMDCKIWHCTSSGTQWVGDGVFGLRKIIWLSYRKKLLPTISTRQLREVRQYENAKSKEMLSLMVYRVKCSLFSPRERQRLPPVTAWSTPSITMSKTRACRDCPYGKIKLTKLSLNSLLDKFPTSTFL